MSFRVAGQSCRYSALIFDRSIQRDIFSSPRGTRECPLETWQAFSRQTRRNTFKVFFHGPSHLHRTLLILCSTLKSSADLALLSSTRCQSLQTSSSSRYL